MERQTRVKELKRLLSRELIDWNRFLELDKDLSAISSSSFRCSFPWLLCKYPPKEVLHELLSRYQHYLFANDQTCSELLVAALSYSCAEIIRFVAHKDKKLLGIVLGNSLDIPLHRAGTDEIASLLLQAYPEGVGVQNKRGNLPLHLAIMHYKSPNHVKLLISEGMKQQVGEGHSGGILVKNNSDETPFSILCKQAATGIDIASIRFPLYRSDLRLWENFNTLVKVYCSIENAGQSDGPFRIMHSLISSGCPQQAVFMAYTIVSEQIKEADEEGRYPLSLAAGQKSCQKLILSNLFNAYPQAILMVDKEGRLPLHWAAFGGRNLEEGAKELIIANPAALRLADNLGMVPFMLAASNSETSLNTIYHLLRESPDNFSGTGYR